jgi:hypothetical protein
MGTCSLRLRDHNILLVSSILTTLAIWLACLYPAAQLLRLVDQIAAAIAPGVSVVRSLHDLLSAAVSALYG